MRSVEVTFLKSAISDSGSINDLDYVLDWVKAQNECIQVDVTRIEIDHLDMWSLNPDGDGLSHNSGRFFCIQGLRVRTNWGQISEWDQPIINQPEIGYLGIIVREINGILHFLLQAKVEPGNVNHVQLSPTIQATRSNYTQVHKGRKPHYLECFQNVKSEDVLLDQLQSEQGSRFFKKRNRNIIIRVEEEIEVLDNFIWVTLKQIKALMRYPNIVNMDTRTVIAGIRFGDYMQPEHVIQKLINEQGLSSNNDSFYSSTAENAGIHSIGDVIHFITDIKSQLDLKVEKIPLESVREWNISAKEVSRDDGRFFRVIGVDVSISNREVMSWQQPMIDPTQKGVCAFIVKIIDGVAHFAVHAKMECGNLDLIEFAPTVQSLLTGDDVQDFERVPCLGYVLRADKTQIIFDQIQSEEGGRFYQEQNRYMIVMADESFSDQLPENYIWMTMYQLLYFCQFNNYLNIQARSLLSSVEFI